jgi:hypothetical protein
MIRQCPACRRANPQEATFCFFDGKLLGNGAGAGEASSINFGTLAFGRPFVFPGGEKCHNFLQLALACRRNPKDAIEALRGGFIGSFFGSLGRVDLAMAVKPLAAMPDEDRALDELLGKLPGTPLRPAELAVEPLEKNFGVLQVGEDREFTLTLTNKGDRLIYGKVSVAECPWLAVGEGGAPEKIFQFFEEITIPVRLPGKRLPAFARTQRGEITVESNVGEFTVAVQIFVPVKPFPEGVLSGALSPRQMAAKAKEHPREAAVLIEAGAVARWYQSNGWTYPVQGPTASGIAAVQQLFEVLGLVKPPKVELSESAITLRGKSGERLEYVLTVLTQEKRSVVAHAVSDQPWLIVGKTSHDKQMATIPLTVEQIPDEPGQTLTAHLEVTGNGRQRFDVPVSLVVGSSGADTRKSRKVRPSPDEEVVPAKVRTPAPKEPAAPAPFLETVAAPVMQTLAEAEEVEELEPEPVSPFAFDQPAPARRSAPSRPAPAPEPLPAPVMPAATSPAAPVPTAAPESAPARKGIGRLLLARLLPVAIVVIGLGIVVGRDAWFREEAEEPPPAVDYANPLLDLRFHDQTLTDQTLGGQKLPTDAAMGIPGPTMRFGLGIPDLKDPNKFKTKLIFDEYGRTCNVMVRLDKTGEFMFGVEQGAWEVPIKQPLGKDPAGNRLIGAKCKWVRKDPTGARVILTVTQFVEIVPGGLSPDGKKQLLDTCKVYYHITNEDAVKHDVALRFLLDTFIGSNDAVPFTIAGAKELCDSSKDFNKPADVPDYISALEKQDLKDPGTVAHLTLRYPGLEPPSRVTLGAWPAASLRTIKGGEKADRHLTRWEVPVLGMDLAKSQGNPNGDSAVTMYWEDKELAPKKTRILGFAYGLGSVSGDKGSGELGITAGGELVAEKPFTLTAYVKNPAPGTTITLKLPRGMKFASGQETEKVPAIPAGASSAFSPVTWRVQADKGGVYRLKATLSTGATIQHRLVIKQAGKIY